MKLLVTGASGLLGAAVVRTAAAQGHTVTAVVGQSRQPIPGATTILPLDLEDLAATTTALERDTFTAVINCAAVAEPAQCVTQPERSQRLNVDLPAHLARLSAARGARFLHLSSEQVFDGERAPYAIGDTPAPLNLYGRQKVASEQAVLAAHAGAAVLRVPLLLGNSLGGHRSVHEKFFETWAAGKPVKLYRDEIRQVCTADNLAEALVELCPRADLRGVLHWAGTEPISRWELGLRMAAHFGVPATPDRLQPMMRADTPEISATRPRDLALDLLPLSRELRTRPETVAEAVAKLARPAWVL